MNTVNLSTSSIPCSVPSGPSVHPVDINDHYGSYMEALYHMEQQGVRHLGWLNSGIDVPGYYCFRRIYKNLSGSSCLFVDPIYRVSYSVDMG
jgi:hypothetical protein